MRRGPAARSRVRGFCAAVALVASACGGAQPADAPSAGRARVAAADVRGTCPLGVTNARVTYEETPTGVALLFTTTPEHVAELRARASDAAAMHGAGQHVGAGHDGPHGEGKGRHGLQPSTLPRAMGAAEDLPDGARVRFTPVDPKDLQLLRRKLQDRATEMMLEGCD